MAVSVAQRSARSSRTWLITGGAAACAVWAIGGQWIVAVNGWGDDHLLQFLSGASYLGAGLFALSRRPRNLIGTLLLLYGFLWFLRRWLTLLPPPIEAVLAVIAFSPAGALLVHIALAFPSGRIATRFGRAVVIATYVFLLATSFLSEATGTVSGACNVDFCHTKLALWPSESAAAVVSLVTNIGTFVIVAATIAAFWQHRRRSSPAQRRDLRPIWIPLVLLGIAYCVESALTLTGAPEDVRELSRDLRVLVQIVAPVIICYGLLTARAAVSRVGHLVRTFRRPSPGGLEAALASALRDPGMRIRYPDESGRWPGADVGPDAATIIPGSDGAPRAALVHDPGLDPSAVAAAAAAAGLVLENEALAAQVQAQLADVRASRARIVAAADAERRRVERNLHDGAQQRLATLALVLRTASRQVETGNADAAQTLREAADELRSATDELRELARGIHPAVLTDGGLRPAVESLAARTPVDDIDVDVVAGRFDPRLEAAVYYVVSEALANVVKHAGASRLSIVIAPTNDHLRVEIADDGVGGAVEDKGSGLGGLADRVGAAGGTLEVRSPSGGGTTVTAVLPLDQEPDS